MSDVANGVKLPLATFIGERLYPPEKKDNRVQMSLRLDTDLHRKVVAKMAPLRLKFQTLVEGLMERWITGEFDRQSDRPITAAESEEDREILRIVHRPANRAEVLAGTAIKRYLELLDEDR